MWFTIDIRSFNKWLFSNLLKLICRLTNCHRVTHLAIDVTTVRLGWKLDSRGGERDRGEGGGVYICVSIRGWHGNNYRGKPAVTTVIPRELGRQIHILPFSRGDGDSMIGITAVMGKEILLVPQQSWAN